MRVSSNSTMAVITFRRHRPRPTTHCSSSSSPPMPRERPSKRGIHSANHARRGSRLVFGAPDEPHRVRRVASTHLKNCDESRFVKLRTERDRSLPMPALILSALQVNLAGGRLPAPEADGRRYLKVPLNAFPHALWEGLEPGLK